MATSQDFDDLIVRITTATNTLEDATNVIDNGSADIQQAVTDAQAAATASGVSAQDAQDAYDDAAQLVTDLEAAVIIEEAPQDGEIYGRQNAAWVLAGSGAVSSVNNISPDGTGDVTLSASDVDALPDTYTPAWLDITGKPTFATVATSGDYGDLLNTPSLATVATSGAYSDLTGTPTLATVATSGAYSDLTGTPTIPTATSDLTNDSDFISDAPADGEQYARQDNGWTVVATGGGGSGGFAFDEPNVTYDGSPITAWPHSNPNKGLNTDLLSVDVGGTTTVTAEDIFLDSEAIQELPEGKYYAASHTGTWSTNPFGDTYFVSFEVVTRVSRKQCFAYIFTGSGGTDNSIWMLEDGFGSNTWVKVAASSVT